VKINFKRGWHRILIILSVVWGGFCFYIVADNTSKGFVPIIVLSSMLWVVGLGAFLLCSRLIGWVIAGFRDENNESK